MTTRVAPSPITPAQRKALFAIAAARGKDINDLREMTPRKSISALTRCEAAELLDRLNKGTAHERSGPPAKQPRECFRRGKGIFRFVSDEQRDLIIQLRTEIGWSEEFFRNWLGKKHYSDDRHRQMTDMKSSKDAAQVIELLKGVRERTELAKAKREEATDAPPF